MQIAKQRCFAQRCCKTRSMKYAIVIHGGAGVVNTQDQQRLDSTYKGLEAALSAGLEVLKEGGSALDAVEAAVVHLENDPHFNAGHGAVYTRNCRHELEASVMTSDLQCGAATLLTRVKNPVKLARAVMEKTPHVFISGADAEAFADGLGMDLVDNEYFHTAQRYEQWAKYNKAEQPISRQDELVQHTQTVGAVAIDSEGRLAAATSTGGRTNKWDGRIGDSPVIGAGTYAGKQCAVSGTGVGEEFLRHTVAYDIAAQMKYGGKSLQAAAEHVVRDVLRPGDGGVIAVDSDYNIVMEFNSVGMYRGAADHTGRFEVAAQRDDSWSAQ